MSEAFRDRLWADTADVRARIAEHPFITGLCDGTLSRDAFAHYVIQDAHYLRHYTRALTACAARAPIPAETAMFLDHAAGAIAAERDLHAQLLDALGLDPLAAAAAPIAPTTLAYTSYLTAVTATGDYAEAVAAVLPCYWIYAEVGEQLAATGSVDPVYQRWIDSYAGEQFQQVVAQVLAVADRLGAAAGSAQRTAMGERFHTAARYEWLFFDAAYRCETWPV